jgi:hypothetical protein
MSMRRWTYRIISALALGLSLPAAGYAAVPAAVVAPHAPTITRTAVQDVRWINRCHVRRVWRHTSHGRRLVPVRSCRRVWIH